ncbi:ATP-binding cassette domain-containing protein, partial [uncultured Microbulbifer sp.]|uniref:ATP-binding cassette domain-containing protein n=1 Tax=uncultured Microbulbifer sp. TaxID=348147 RepID=UPI0026341D5F
WKLTSLQPADLSRYCQVCRLLWESRQLLCYIRDLYFCCPSKDKAALEDCNLSIYPGGRLLLQGASVSGKSTLVNVITGVQKPDNGLLLINGYDRASIGVKHWCGLVASVSPNFMKIMYLVIPSYLTY